MKNQQSTLMLILLIAILLPLGAIAQDFWEPTGSIASTNDAYRIVTDSEGRIFVGVNGTAVFVSNDGGSSWTSSGVTNQNIMDMAVNSNDHVFALGNNTVHRSTDHGNTWANVGTGLPGASVNTIAIGPDGTIFIGLYGQKIYRSSNNGTTWTRLENGLSTNTSYASMAINSSGHIFSGTNGAHIFRSVDNGDNWDRVASGLPSPEAWALSIDSEDRVFAGTGNGICVSLNNGSTWTVTSPGSPSFDINDMVVDSDDHIFATNFHGGVWRSEDHGNSWENIEDPVSGEVSWGLGMSSDNYLLCGSGNGQVYRSQDPTIAPPSPFTAIQTNLKAMANSSVEWGDYDSDGDLDILMVGKDDNSNYAKIYRNDGFDSFVEHTNTGLQAVMNGPVSWGDYDNDGDLDILMTGYDGGSHNFSILYDNDGAGTFSDHGIDLTPMGSGSVEWVDYDNDGDLDIFISGWNGSTNFALIYRNDNGYFTDINAGLPGVRSGSSPWGDYDNDGDLDLLLTGWDGVNRYTQIFQNIDGIFVDIEAGLRVVSGSAAWGDYDEDGDLDILLAGYGAETLYETRFYENDDGLFIEVDLGLPRVNKGTVDWGDYDNDGDLDILLSGNDGTNFIADIFENKSGIFSATNAGLQGVRFSALAWGDYDNDNDLDILLTGHDGVDYHTIIYRNDPVRANTVPSAPGNLVSTVDGSRVTLNWDSASDIETENTALSYNIRIGSTLGGIEVKTAQASLADGSRMIVECGNVGQMNGWVINDLPDGNYSWSVQAIDNNFAGSAFSVEQSFVLGETPDAPDAFTDAATNIGSTTSTLNGRMNPNSLSTSVIFEYGLSTVYGSIVTVLGSPFIGDTELTVGVDLSGLAEDQIYHFRLVAESSAGITYGADQQFTTISIGDQPVAITHAATEMTLTSAMLNAAVQPGDLVTSVMFEYGNTSSYGSQIAADQASINGSNEQEITAQLSNLIENTNYHFRVVATNAKGTSEGADQTFTTLINYPETIELQATSDAYPEYDNADEYTAADYRLVGLPGNSDLSAATLLNGAQGEDWQIYWDNGSSENYLVEYDESTDFNFSVGRSFWLINKGSFDIDVSTDAATLNSNDEIEIPLHSGWNLITNPLTESVMWSTVQSLNNITEPLWSFDGTFSNATSFDSFQGYYYFNTNDISMLKVHYHDASLGKTNSRTLTPDRWGAEIKLFAGNTEAATLKFGTSSDAQSLNDAYDSQLPRAVGDISTLCFSRPEWNTTYHDFAADIRPPIRGTELWEFDLTSIASESNRLEFSGLESIPTEYAAYLLNLGTGVTTDLRADNVYELPSHTLDQRYTIAVGFPDLVENTLRVLVPETLVLAHNFPNPFNPSTSIRYALPDPASVTLNIYDISGGLVNSLVTTSQDAGWYTVQWNGRTNAGLQVEAGIYFAQISTGASSEVIRMVYLP